MTQACIHEISSLIERRKLCDRAVEARGPDDKGEAAADSRRLLETLRQFIETSARNGKLFAWIRLVRRAHQEAMAFYRLLTPAPTPEERDAPPEIIEHPGNKNMTDESAEKILKWQSMNPEGRIQ